MSELGIDPLTYNEAASRNDPALSAALSSDEDTANIRRRVRYATVYSIESAEGAYETVVLPVSGFGLWGIMYGYLAIEGDGNTIRGIGFYDHKETPGLGGEISNPRWQAQWPGKQIFDTAGDVAFELVKGGGEGESQVDALSGATLTSRGVENMIAFWLGQRGFGSFLTNEVKG
jgi:Na+-transporting NADH:ubiquinone oxidoreductase subunit C